MSTTRAAVAAGAYTETVRAVTGGPLEFIDLTDAVQQVVSRSGVATGIVVVQTTHTTTAVLVNENEPLLLEDLRATLERLAPRDAAYRHDDLESRTVNVTPDERPNGHSHCKALFLRASETLAVVAGRLALGAWQRVMLVELDGGRPRTVRVVVLGPAF